MNGLDRIPEQFWGLFHSRNRMIYMEALIVISQEYLYNDYFLSRDACIQLLREHFAGKQLLMVPDDDEEESSLYEPDSTRILGRLIAFQWLKRVEDHSTLTVNITIPDYAAVFIDALERLDNPELEEADLYIQNIYANIYSFYHDPRAGIELLRTAQINTQKLNKALQDMLHNMDSFFTRLLQLDSYGDVLSEHLDGYVESIVKGKYHLLKTDDNFYRYKTEVRSLLRKIEEDEVRMSHLRKRRAAERGCTEDQAEEEITAILDRIEQGFSNMERRIANIDAEHNKYVRVTVSRLSYLLSSDRSMKGLVVELLNRLSRAGDEQQEEMLDDIGNAVQLGTRRVLNKELLYKRRGKNRVFEETIAEPEPEEDISREEVLRLNRSRKRYSRSQMEHFILDRMEGGELRADQLTMDSEEQFEMLVLAYDYSTRKSCPYEVVERDVPMIEKDGYRYPQLVFRRKKRVKQETADAPGEDRPVQEIQKELVVTREEEPVIAEVQGQYSMFEYTTQKETQA